MEAKKIMSGSSLAHTEVLDFEAAKKLLSSIKKQPSPGGWKDVFGPNGSQKEIKLEDVTADALRDVDLTSFCSSVMDSGSGR